MEESGANTSPPLSSKSTREELRARPVLFYGLGFGALMGMFIAFCAHWLVVAGIEEEAAERTRQVVEERRLTDWLRKKGELPPAAPGEQEVALPAPPELPAAAPWLGMGAALGGFFGLAALAVCWFYWGTLQQVGTSLGVIFGLLPAALMLVAALGSGLSPKMLVGLIMIGPMVGMLLGGVADRIYEQFFMPAQEVPRG